jgi:NodT family efflux transporter outer membrane factor (OMF) lipoprotein
LPAKTISLPSTAKVRLRGGLLLACCLALGGCLAPKDQLVVPEQRTVSELERNSTRQTIQLQENWWELLNDPQLNRLIALALERAPSLQIAGVRIAAAQALANAQQAVFAPQVGVAAQIDQQRFSQNYFFAPGMQTYNGYGLIQANMTWSLDIWGKQRKYFEAATHRVSAARLNVEASKLLLSSTIVKTYLNYDRAVKFNALSVKDAAIRNGLYQISQARQTAGLTDVVETKQRLSDRDLAQARLTQSSVAIKLLQHQLGALTQQGPSAGEKILSPQLDWRGGDLPTNIPANLLARRPDLQVLLEQIEASELDYAGAKLEYLPDINLQGYAGLQAIGLPLLLTSSSQVFSLGPSLSLPIFEGGRIAANALGKESLRNERISAYQEQLLTALKEAADGIATVDSTSSELNQTQQALSQTENNLLIAQQRKQAGLTTTDNVWMAELNVIEQRKQVLDTYAKVYDAKISLIQALGGSYLRSSNQITQAP